jgi:hypothetical protein
VRLIAARWGRERRRRRWENEREEEEEAARGRSCEREKEATRVERGGDGGIGALLVEKAVELISCAKTYYLLPLLLISVKKLWNKLYQTGT